MFCIRDFLRLRNNAVKERNSVFFVAVFGTREGPLMEGAEIKFISCCRAH